MSDHVFNPGLPQLGAALRAPRQTELEDVRCFKYADFEYAYANCENDYVRYVLDQIPIFGKHERVLVDIKVHDLEPGEIPCVPGWHLDGSINPKNLPKKPETLTLFVTGGTALTEFLAMPITLPVGDEWSFASMSRRCARQIPKSHPVWTIPGCTFGTYDDHYFHRGAIAMERKRRLLVRTTETDIITPQNKIYTPYTHKV